MNIVITGATKGMGRAITYAFAKEGAKLALTARTQADLQSLHQELALKYPDIEVLIFPADLSKSDQVEAFASKIKQSWKQVDGIINNAGIFLQGSLTDEAIYSLQRMMAINLYAPILLTQELLPMMIRQGSGHIFNICSIASRVTLPNIGFYSATKAALLSFTNSLREELREKGIKVTAVLPGATWSNSWEGAQVDPQRLLRPEDIALSIVSAYKLSPGAVVEELLIRPQGGDV